MVGVEEVRRRGDVFEVVVDGDFVAGEDFEGGFDGVGDFEEVEDFEGDLAVVFEGVNLKAGDEFVLDAEAELFEDLGQDEELGGLEPDAGGFLVAGDFLNPGEVGKFLGDVFLGIVF